MPAESRYAAIGGQAVIEGVMMRSPSFVATAVRCPDGTIAVRRTPFVSWSKRLRLLGLPIFRGMVSLIESMQIGMSALSYSAELAAAAEPGDGAEEASARARAAAEKDRRARFWNRLAIPFTIVLSLGLGIGLFFWLPLVLTELTGARSGFAFNVIDGGFRLAIFFAYILAISRWGEMRRVFQYHGAEHKSIAALEAGDELTPERVATHSRFHPRCGTSFLLLVMLASIAVFMFFGRPDTLGERLVRFLAIPLIGGVAFEVIRLSGRFSDHPLLRPVILPGLLLQRITTREPSLDQIEVAIRSVVEVTRESGGKLVPI
jgi:uncharacterized protein YqhQ